MDADILKCRIAASLADAEILRDDDNLDSKGTLVRSADGKAFRIAVSEVQDEVRG